MVAALLALLPTIPQVQTGATHIFTTKVHGDIVYQGAGADVHAFYRFAAPDPWALGPVFSTLNFDSEVKDCSLGKKIGQGKDCPVR